MRVMLYKGKLMYDYLNNPIWHSWNKDYKIKSIIEKLTEKDFSSIMNVLKNFKVTPPIKAKYSYKNWISDKYLLINTDIIKVRAKKLEELDLKDTIKKLFEEINRLTPLDYKMVGFKEDYVVFSTDDKEKFIINLNFLILQEMYKLNLNIRKKDNKILAYLKKDGEIACITTSMIINDNELKELFVGDNLVTPLDIDKIYNKFKRNIEKMIYRNKLADNLYKERLNKITKKYNIKKSVIRIKFNPKKDYKLLTNKNYKCIVIDEKYAFRTKFFPEIAIKAQKFNPEKFTYDFDLSHKLKKLDKTKIVVKNNCVYLDGKEVTPLILYFMDYEIFIKENILFIFVTEKINPADLVGIIVL